MDTTDITIEMRKLKNSGNLKAFADVTLPTSFGEVTLRGFRVIQIEGNDPWVAMPNSSYMKDGQRKTSDLLEVPRSLKARLQALVLERYSQEPPF